MGGRAKKKFFGRNFKKFFFENFKFFRFLPDISISHVVRTIRKNKQKEKEGKAENAEEMVLKGSGASS